MTYSQGDRVMLTTDRYSNYNNAVTGTSGTVRADYGHEIVVDFDNIGRLYVTPNDVSVENVLTLPLDAYKVFVVKTLFEHKALNNWCGTAEYLARQMGCTDLLPSYVSVERIDRVQTFRFPGETDQMVLQRAQREEEDRWARQRYSIGTETPQPRDGHEDAPDGETADEFRARLAETAIQGARDNGVQGVEDFLTAVGIPTDPITYPRTAYVTVAVDVEVGIGESASDAARSLVERDGYNVTEAYAD